MTGRGGSASGGFHEELRWEKVPDGAQRSRSTQTPSYDRDLLRDRSGNLQPARRPSELRPANMDEVRRFARPGRSEQAAEAVIDAAITAHPLREESRRVAALTG